MSESELVDWLRSRTPVGPGVALGIGDDAAVLAPTRGQTLVTVDTLTDQVDFDLTRDDPRRVGRKALAVNLSDIAAMAGRPVAAFVALVLPRAGGEALARELYAGMLPLAAEFETTIAGGDTNSWDGPLAISITLVGEVAPQGPLTRAGARVGDRILVSGEFGGSRLGKQFDFTPRVQLARSLLAHYPLHAGMDVSDGLALDLSRLAAASGLGAELAVDHVPIAAAAREFAECTKSGRSPLEHALSDGEDFELILAAPPAAAEQMVRDNSLGVALTDVGQFIAEPGLWQVSAKGVRTPLPPTGWQHTMD